MVLFAFGSLIRFSLPVILLLMARYVTTDLHGCLAHLQRHLVEHQLQLRPRG